MANILVTGGAGFIGSHVAQDCLAAGHKVWVLDDLSGGRRDNVPAAATFVEGSILDQTLINQLFRAHKFEVCFHLAAYAAEILSHFIRNFNYQNNLVGSVNLLNAAVNFGCRRFVFTSSIAVYGELEPPHLEIMTPSPEDPYGIAKYAFERDLFVARKMWGIETTVFRPHNVYGAGQNLADKYRNVIGIFINQIINGKAITIFGDGEQTRAFSYVRDIAPVMVEAAFRKDCDGEIFNIGSDVVTNLNQLAHAVCFAMNVKAEDKIMRLEARPESKHVHASHDKLKALFPHMADTSLADGLREMVAWAAAADPGEPETFAGVECDKDMPPSWKASLGTNVRASRA